MLARQRGTPRVGAAQAQPGPAAPPPPPAASGDANEHVGASRDWLPRLSGIRARIVVSYVLLFGVALVVVLVIVRHALLSRLDADVERRLTAEVEQLERAITMGDLATGEPYEDAGALFDAHLGQVLPGDDQAYYVLVEGDPYLLSFDAPTDLLADPALVEQWGSVEESTWQRIDTDAGRARVLVVPVRVGGEARGTFVVTAFTDAAREDVDDVVRLVAGVGGIVLVVTGLLAWSLAGAIVRPIRKLTAVTKHVSDSDLSARIPVDGDDEVAELGHTFNAMVHRLDESFQRQRDFLDDVAHELRTPITIVQGHLDVVGGSDDDTVDLVSDELERMNRYVTDLLMLARADRPDFLRPGPVDLELFTAALMSKAQALGDRNWVRDVLPVDELPIVEFDEQRAMQAMLNLAQNAVEHTAHDDEIGIGVDWEDGQATMWVRDTGTGIDPAILDSLFVRHVRSASSRRDGGTGIGLSIVDAIAEAHRGEVEATSEPDAGATFVVRLPAAEHEPATTR